MMKPVIFFDLGQTLVDEWDFISYFDKLLFESLNGYGARIDLRNYITLRNNMIINRKIGYAGLLDIVSLTAQLILPRGYDSTLFNNLYDNLLENKNKLLK